MGAIWHMLITDLFPRFACHIRGWSFMDVGETIICVPLNSIRGFIIPWIILDSNKGVVLRISGTAQLLIFKRWRFVPYTNRILRPRINPSSSGGGYPRGNSNIYFFCTDKHGSLCMVPPYTSVVICCIILPRVSFMRPSLIRGRSAAGDLVHVLCTAGGHISWQPYVCSRWSS